VGCFAGYLVGREAARRLVPLGRGTVIFTGASGSLPGKPGFAQFAAAKAGLRMIAQSMARELGPKGIHVAHVVIDGGINGLLSRAPDLIKQRGEDGLLSTDAIAETYWSIHRQSRTAWARSGPALIQGAVLMRPTAAAATGARRVARPPQPNRSIAAPWVTTGHWGARLSNRSRRSTWASPAGSSAMRKPAAIGERRACVGLRPKESPLRRPHPRMRMGSILAAPTPVALQEAIGP
jgi:hypothetical protein